MKKEIKRATQSFWRLLLLMVAFNSSLSLFAQTQTISGIVLEMCIRDSNKYDQEIFIYTISNPFRTNTVCRKDKLSVFFYYHPVARNDDGKGIMPHRTAHSLAGHALSPQPGRHLLSDFAVGGHLPVWDLA